MIGVRVFLWIAFAAEERSRLQRRIANRRAERLCRCGGVLVARWSASVSSRQRKGGKRGTVSVAAQKRLGKGGKNLLGDGGKERKCPQI